MPPTRRIAFAAVVALCVGLTVVVAAAGLQHRSRRSSAIETIGRHRRSCAAVVFGGAITIGLRLADWREPESEEEFEQVVAARRAAGPRGARRRARRDASSSTSTPTTTTTSRSSCATRSTTCPTCCAARVETQRRGRHLRRRAPAPARYGLYHGDGATRDDVPDRIVIYRDTLRRDFGHDPDLLRDQVTRTVRHELAHHIGFDELGVRDLGL